MSIGRPYYATKRLVRPVHCSGDGLSSPWDGVIALLFRIAITPYNLHDSYARISSSIERLIKRSQLWRKVADIDSSNAATSTRTPWSEQ